MSWVGSQDLVSAKTQSSGLFTRRCSFIRLSLKFIYSATERIFNRIELSAIQP